MPELISVIVPIYNVERYLEKCIDSILAQTYRNLEVILIDDGSKDDSGTICDAYAAADSRVKVIHQQNGGAAAAKNAGLRAATGEYLSFVDADDWIDPQTYETALAAAGMAVALPQLVHALGAFAGLGTGLGELLLPMHLPVMLAGMLWGPVAGLACGFLLVLENRIQKGRQFLCAGTGDFRSNFHTVKRHTHDLICCFCRSVHSVRSPFFQFLVLPYARPDLRQPVPSAP